MYFVLGATGQTGRAVVAALQARGCAVRAASRRVAPASPGVESVQVDITDRDGLVAAMRGCRGAYLMLPPFVTATNVLATSRRAAYTLASAADHARVPRVVVLSSGGAHRPSGTGLVQSLYDLERAFDGAACELTFVRAADFLENWKPYVDGAKASGVLPSARQPLDVPMKTVAADDIGRIAADYLADPNEPTRIVNVHGPAEYSPLDIAAAAADVFGRPVEAVPIPIGALVEGVVAAGASRDYAQRLAEVYEALNAGVIDFEPGVGEDRRGRLTPADGMRAWR